MENEKERNNMIKSLFWIVAERKNNAESFFEYLQYAYEFGKQNSNIATVSMEGKKLFEYFIIDFNHMIFFK
ncbi:MAG: hypothetical protein FAF03_06220 [Epsilonproteobacteria bacterium]|nr:hypothetical protein [Campylobacterota bacterium]